VTVDQDIVKLETGEGGGSSKQEASTPANEPAQSKQPATSDPEPKKETPAPAPPKEEKKAPPPPPSEDKPTSKKDEKKPEASPSGAGSRGETRVCLLPTRNHSLILGR
jgi:hypothetical protein